MNAIIKQLVLKYLLEWIQSNPGANIHWAAFQTAALVAVTAFIAKLIPLQWADAALDQVASVAISDVVVALQAGLGDVADETQLINDAVAGNWTAAWTDIEAILGKAVSAGSAKAKDVLAAHKAAA